MLTDHDKQGTENREPANEMNEEDSTQSIPDWLQPFTENLQDLETRMCPHIPLKERPQIRKVMLQKWRHKNGSTVFMLTSEKETKEIFSAISKVWRLDNSRAQNPQRKL